MRVRVRGGGAGGLDLHSVKCSARFFSECLETCIGRIIGRIASTGVNVQFDLRRARRITRPRLVVGGQWTKKIEASQVAV